MCAKLHTVAASNNRVHAPKSLLLLARTSHIYCCSSRTSRSWWITQSTQRHHRGCNNNPSFLQRTTPIARSLCEGWSRHDLRILVTAPFCSDRKSRAACAQSFALWQQATIKFARRDHYITACSRHIYVLLFFAYIPFVVKHVFNATPPERLQHCLLCWYSETQTWIRAIPDVQCFLMIFSNTFYSW